jgi:hypothetical protein
LKTRSPIDRTPKPRLRVCVRATATRSVTVFAKSAK